MASKTITTTTPQLHVLIVSYPCQGAINPLLRLAKLLASTSGFLVTFSTTATAGQKIINANGLTSDVDHLYPVGHGFFRFEFFDIDHPCIYHRSQFPEFLTKLELNGRKRLPEMIRRLSNEGRPVSCIIKGDIVPWVSDVAGELGIPLAALWSQSCSSLLTFYHYEKKLVPFPTEDCLQLDVEIPSLPLLKWDEIHSFLHPSYIAPFMRDLWLRDIRSILDKPFCVLLDTFDELEPDVIRLTTELCPTVKPVGPLFLNPHQPNNIGANLQRADFDCLRWLDTKPPRSVIYVSFGTIVLIKQEQLDEIAYGIMNTGAPFLWVTREPGLNSLLMPAAKGGGEGINGRVVEYSPQEKVLAHPSVACFVTHCGWNSTMEAVSSGVPTVVFPQLADQLTNAKFMVDVFGVAVRMGRGEHEEKVVTREEVERCVREATVGPKAEEIRKNAATWKDKAEKVCQEGGSSDANLRGFVDEIRQQLVKTGHEQTDPCFGLIKVQTGPVATTS